MMREFKKYTSKKIIHTISEKLESRREWMLRHFQQACVPLKRQKEYKVCKDGYHAEIVETNWFIKQKINYIHNNPVKEKIVILHEGYYFSSAINYASLENELEVIIFIILAYWSGNGFKIRTIGILL